MKKKLLLTIISIVVALVAISATGCTHAQFDLKEQGKVGVGEEAYQYLTLFATPEYADRSADTGKDLAFCKYLADKLTSWGYIPKAVESDGVAGIEKFNYYYDDGEKVYSGSSYNVEFTKAASTQSRGRIILTAQYDNRYSYSGIATEADGSYESGASVAALLTISRLLSDKDLDFDITIAFLGCSTISYNGAEHMLKNMSDVQKQEVLLAIDISNIIGGDYTYLYTIDKSTDYGDFFDQLATVNSLNFASVPKDKKVGSARLIDNGLYNYFHVGMFSNNMYFMNEGIPTLTISSFNWDKSGSSGRVEFDGKESLLQTPADSFDNMVARVGEEEIKARFDDIVSVVYLAIAQEGEALASALTSSRDQMPSRLAQSAVANSVLTVAPKIIVITALILIMFQVRKRVNDNREKYLAIRHANAKSQPIDVFGFDDEEGKDNSNDSSDGGVFDGF
ncbi:MAG: M28 family peptidase [Christensenellales bacterium]